MNKILIALIGCIMATSCAVRTATSTSISVDARVTQYPTVVDLDVDPNLASKEVRWTFIESLIKKAQIKKAHSTIVYDMLHLSKSDVLLEKKTQKTVIPFGATTIMISGYPAKFKNFRKPTLEEINAISSLNASKELYVVGE